MKKLQVKSEAQVDSSLWYIIIGDAKIFHGDKITAQIQRGSDDEEEMVEITDAKLCINKVDLEDRAFRAWICHDDSDWNGCTEANDKFEYEHSWVFDVDKDGNITSDDTEYVLPAHKRSSVIIGDVEYHEGCLVQATLGSGSSKRHVVVGRINILNITPTTTEFVICQDIRAGSEKFSMPPISGVKHMYGFKHSWSVIAKNNKTIGTTDTKDFKLVYTADYMAFISGASNDKPIPVTADSDVDDDPMPEDWTPSEKDLIFLR
jgi:hypothetical protein